MTIALIIFAMILYIEASAITFIALYYGSKDDVELGEKTTKAIVVGGTILSPLFLPIILYAGFKMYKNGDLD